MRVPPTRTLKATDERLKTLALNADNSLVALLTIWLLMSPFMIVGCLKGRYALSIVGVFFVFGIPAVLASTRLARRDSWWAKRFYDADRLGAAAARYRGKSRLNDALTL